MAEGGQEPDSSAKVIAIVGKSKAGKSTLIKNLLGEVDLHKNKVLLRLNEHQVKP